MSWKDLTEGRYIVAGSPETVRQQLEELIKTLRVGNIFCLLHIGNMPDDKVRHSTKLFAEKVMPHLRNLWPIGRTTTTASGAIPCTSRCRRGLLPNDIEVS